MPDEVAREIQEAMQAQTRGGQVPPLEMLVGYEAQSIDAPEGRMAVLWANPTGSASWLIKESDIVRRQQLEPEASPHGLGGSVLWVKQEAQVEHRSSTNMRADQAKFVRGGVTERGFGEQYPDVAARMSPYVYWDDPPFAPRPPSNLSYVRPEQIWRYARGS